MDFTVLNAKNNLSSLLRRAETGEPVYIRRGRKGPRFRVVPEPQSEERVLEPNPKWAKGIRFEDAAIWESEWKDES